MKLILFLLCCGLVYGRDYSLTVQNQVGTNLLVGPLWVNAGTAQTFKVDEGAGPWVCNFGGTNLIIETDADRTLIFGEAFFVDRVESSPKDYFLEGFFFSAGLALVGWAVKILRKLAQPSLEL